MFFFKPKRYELFDSWFQICLSFHPGMMIPIHPYSPMFCLKPTRYGVHPSTLIRLDFTRQDGISPGKLVDFAAETWIQRRIFWCNRASASNRGQAMPDAFDRQWFYFFGMTSGGHCGSLWESEASGKIQAGNVNIRR